MMSNTSPTRILSSGQPSASTSSEDRSQLRKGRSLPSPGKGSALVAVTGALDRARRGGGVAGAGLAGGLAVAGERALDGGGEEAGEQRVRAVRPRAELRVELRADHPGVVADLTRPACLSLRLPGGSLLRRSGRL